MVEGMHHVVALPTNNVTKMADFPVDGVSTEYKGLNSAGSTTVKSAIEKAAQQGANIVIDAREGRDFSTTGTRADSTSAGERRRVAGACDGFNQGRPRQFLRGMNGTRCRCIQTSFEIA